MEGYLLVYAGILAPLLDIDADGSLTLGELEIWLSGLGVFR